MTLRSGHRDKGDDAQASASPGAASSKGGAAQLANDDDDGATQPVPASPTASSSSAPDWGSASRSPSEPRDSDRHGDDAQASASPAAAS